MSTDKTHNYKVSIKCTGNEGLGITNYQTYDRGHLISIDSKIDILGS
jgi:hypothetical protein